MIYLVTCCHFCDCLGARLGQHCTDLLGVVQMMHFSCASPSPCGSFPESRSAHCRAYICKWLLPRWVQQEPVDLELLPVALLRLV